MPIASTRSVWCDPGPGRRPVKDHPKFWTVKGLHHVGGQQCITNFNLYLAAGLGTVLNILYLLRNEGFSLLSV